VYFAAMGQSSVPHCKQDQNVVNNEDDPLVYRYFLPFLLYKYLIQMNEVDQYIMQFPQSVRILLENLRGVIKENAPDAEESIAYGMPAYKTNNKPLVYFAAFKNHVGFYATPSGHHAFFDELSKYKQGKGSVQFPHDQPLPLDLIAGIVKFRVQENIMNSGNRKRPQKKT
jgi:uncharacterized protein YdhG (YjbR/CyaY superfamily)